MSETDTKPAVDDLETAGNPQSDSVSEQTVVAAPVASTPAAGTVGESADGLAAAEARAQEHYDAFLRAKAETDNVRRRAQEDVAKAHKFGIETFADALLPVMDSLDAALADASVDATARRHGVELTRKQLASAFERHRMVEIDPAGQKFDPHRHQAISTVAAPEGMASNHVVTVLQKGWTLAERVLRPALVTVSS